jgi:GNAT superfamily N-acetyltransferase
VTIEPASLESVDARTLIAELDADLRARYPALPTHGLAPQDGVDPRTVFLIARIDGEPVACGASRFLEPSVIEIKRMFVRKAFRGRGISRALLAELESRARAAGAACLRLETGIRQPEAIALYLSAGFTDIPLYGEFVGDPLSRCFEKKLT